MGNLIIDNAVLNNWKNVDPDNWRNLATEFIDLFLSFGADQYEELNEAMRNQEFERVRRVAHSLKSSCGNVGASSARLLFEEMEHYKDLQNLEQLYAKSQILFPETVAEISKFRIQLQAA